MTYLASDARRPTITAAEYWRTSSLNNERVWREDASHARSVKGDLDWANRCELRADMAAQGLSVAWHLQGAIFTRLELESSPHADLT